MSDASPGKQCVYGQRGLPGKIPMGGTGCIGNTGPGGNVPMGGTGRMGGCGGPGGGKMPMGGTGRTGGRQVGQQLGQLLFNNGVHGSRQSQNLNTSGASGAQHGQGGSRPGGMKIGTIGMVSVLCVKVVPCHCMRRAGGGCLH